MKRIHDDDGSGNSFDIRRRAEFRSQKETLSGVQMLFDFVEKGAGGRQHLCIVLRQVVQITVNDQFDLRLMGDKSRAQAFRVIGYVLRHSLQDCQPNYIG